MLSVWLKPPQNKKYCDSMLSRMLTTMSSQGKPVHIDILHAGIGIASIKPFHMWEALTF